MRKPAFYICEKRRRSATREADQRLCFRYMDSTIPLLSKSEISSLKLSSVVLQPGLCRTWSETPKTGFLTTRLILLILLGFGEKSFLKASTIIQLSHCFDKFMAVLSVCTST